jgi:hypothetical protein
LQGCQMVYFQTKNPNGGKYWRALDWKMLTYFTDIWDILWPFVTFCVHLLHLCGFGTMCQEKSGDPGLLYFTISINCILMLALLLEIACMYICTCNCRMEKTV